MTPKQANDRTVAEKRLHASLAVEEIQELLWPEEDHNHEWDSDTPADIAQVLVDWGFGPPEMEDEEDSSDANHVNEES